MKIDNSIDIHLPRQLDALSPEQLDSLPFGAIRVDAEGRILFYSRAQSNITQRERTSVIGRNFFTEVAPCTVVPEFYGRFRRGVLTGQLNSTFEFVFDFEMQPVQVRISMQNSTREGEFWILAQPQRQLPPRNETTAHGLIADKFCTSIASLSASSFDFSQCDREPIATCGAIQPFGCLLALDPDTLYIDACSENSHLYLGQAPEALLDQPLECALRDDGQGALAALGAQGEAARFAPTFFRALTAEGGQPVEVRVHRWRERLLLEIEPHGEMDMDRRVRAFDVGGFQQRLRMTDDIELVCREAVEVFRHLSGFERVLIYRFEPGDDGVVIAESLLPESWPSILGLRYPATDIPRQARALYRETPLRYTPSRDHPDIPLLSRRLRPEQIDIGIAQMRALSPIHRNYLKRFAVNGSMSISIMLEQRLWGLVIFHHRAPHPVTAYTRRRLTELGGCLASRIAFIEERERNRAREQGMAEVNRLLAEIDIEQPFPDNFIGKERLLCELLNADMVQIWHRGQGLFLGQDCGLGAEPLADLLAFVRSRPGPLWSTDCLSCEFEPAAAYPEQLAGVLAIFLDKQREDILLFGRQRSRYCVRWGADPASLPFAEDEARRPLGWPNRTFEVWNEERTHHARPWSAVELAMGEALRTLIQQVIVTNAAHFERLARSLERQRDQLQRSREELRHRALHDALTGLPNRVRFREALLDAIERCRREGGGFAVALLDIDHFKTINDTLGHDKGDVLLGAVSQRLLASLPEQALVARLGGDEFALLLARSQGEDPLIQAEQLIETLRAPIRLADDSFAITCSLGLTLGDGQSEPGELLKQADLALYRAKEEGRNRARPFDSRLQTQAMKQREIDRLVLGRAPREAVEIVLQPQLAIAAREPVRRFEVLARWRTAEDALIMPGDFIPALERNGLIRSLTQQVLYQAIGLIAAELERDPEAMVLAVNVSASDLEASGFARQLIEALHAADVPPEFIEIEVTESMLLRMTPSVKATINQLWRSGVRLSLDDFGTGFSSMAYLRELPISHLKIDREFIRGIASPHDRNLVSGMIAMAHSIGKEVVAEGIETPHQLEALKALGCDWGQGYLWSRPLPPAEALAAFPALAAQGAAD